MSDHRLICFDISKHQPPCKPTIIKFRKVNDTPTQVIKQEISDVLNLCDGIKDPNIYLKSANKAWLTALNKIAPEKESKKRDQKRLPGLMLIFWLKSGIKDRWNLDIWNLAQK